MRKRYKKKLSGSNDEEEDTTDHKRSSNSSSNNNKEGKKKIRSKSKDPKTSGHQSSDGKRRRKKRHSNAKSTSSKSTAPGEETSPNPIAEDLVEDNKPDAETMEKMTYSFEFHSEHENTDWLNSNNSCGSSLSHNSFAQFSLDVGDNTSGHFGDASGQFGYGGGDLNMSGPLGASCGFAAPDLDASTQSFSSSLSLNVDAAVVFMAGKSSKSSLLASHSFDTNSDDGSAPTQKESSSRSMTKPEKKLRRRLKKKDEKDGSDGKNPEGKRKVRRTRSGGVERTKSLGGGKSESGAGSIGASGTATSSGGGRRAPTRTKSHNEATTLLPGGPAGTKLVLSYAKRQERQENKSNRRKKVKDAISGIGNISGGGSGSGKSKQAGKSKSLHMMRSLTTSSPKKILGDHDQDEISTDEASTVNEMDDEVQFAANSFRSPKRSPRTRQIRRTFSNPPCPSPSIHAAAGTTPSTPSMLAKNALNALNMDHSPMSSMSYGSGPSYLDAPATSIKKSRRPSPMRKALLSCDTDSDDSNSCYSPVSTASTANKKKIPSRGLERTPSSMLLAAVRAPFVKGNGNKMLSKVKRTFSVSGRGASTFNFDDSESGGPVKGYVSRRERQRKSAESENRRGQVKNSLYACMDDDDDSVDISSEIFVDESSESGHDFESNSHSSFSSFTPKRIQSLQRNHPKANHPSSEPGPDQPARPRRVNSLPIGIRALPEQHA